jgi:ribosomal protein S5
MEDVMHTLHERMASLDHKQTNQNEKLEQQEKRLSSLKGRISVHRFNAFSDSGSDLSFSVAFVNEEQDGVVITGIHGREQMFLYAKPIDKGQSAYMLTPEEKIAISQAMQKG